MTWREEVKHRWCVIAVVLLSSFLILSLMILLPPTLKAWRRAEGGSYADLLVKGLPLSEAEAEVGDLKLLPPEFFHLLHSFVEGEYSGTPKWRFSALLLGYLRLHNIPLWEESVANAYSAETRSRVRTTEGDTWHALAGEHMGNPDLWPILMVLNYEWLSEDAIEPREGWLIQVPSGVNSDS